MLVRAIKVIRSATIAGHTHTPGDIAEVLSTVVDSLGRKLYFVRWQKDGESCTILATDVEQVEVRDVVGLVSVVADAPAIAPRDAQDGAASSSPVQLHPVRQLVGQAEEPVGTFGPFLAGFGEGGGI
jgi:hypothetical protein